MRVIHAQFLLVVVTSVVMIACKKRDQPAPSPQIETFSFTAARNTGLTQDIAGVINADTIKVMVPRSVDLTHLEPTITYVGAQVSPASGTVVDFSAPVRYAVTGQDGGSHIYWVVVKYPSSDKQITSFQLRPQENPGLPATIDGTITGDTIIVYYSGTLPVNGLTPYVTYKGAQLSPGSGVKTDFTQPVAYTVTAEDGSARTYRVFISSNKLVYIGSDDGYLYAIDAATGAQRWKFNAGGAVHSCPTLAAGIVYVGSSDNHLYAIDSAAGTVKWKVRFNQPVHSCPTVSGGAVYVHCAGYLVSLDAATGAGKWTFKTNDWLGNGSPTVANGMVYLCCINGQFTIGAVNAATGALVWGYRSGIGVSNPAVVDGVVYIGEEVDKLIALDAATGAVKWKYNDGKSAIYTSPTVAAGKVYIGADDGSIYAFDIGTGALQWKFASQGIQYMGYQDATGIIVGLWSSPVYANGRIFAGNNDGLNYAIDGATGSSAWTYGDAISENWGVTKATVANDMVVYGSHDGEVLALDAATGGVKWTFKTKGSVYSGACIVGVDGVVWHPGISGDRN